MHHMRSTFRIDDDLLDELREQAHKEKVPLTLMVNRVLRSGIQALAAAAALEDDEVVREMNMRK